MVGQTSEETFCPDSKAAVRGIGDRHEFLAVGERKAQLIGSPGGRGHGGDLVRSRRPSAPLVSRQRLDQRSARIPSMVIVRLKQPVMEHRVRILPLPSHPSPDSDRTRHQ